MSLVVPGCPRLSPVVPGCPWLSLVVPGCPLLSPVVPGCPWLSPVVPGCPRLSPVVSDRGAGWTVGPPSAWDLFGHTCRKSMFLTVSIAQSFETVIYCHFAHLALAPCTGGASCSHSAPVGANPSLMVPVCSCVVRSGPPGAGCEAAVASLVHLRARSLCSPSAGPTRPNPAGARGCKLAPARHGRGRF